MISLAQAGEGDALQHFEKSVRPLLLQHCVECHGPEKQKGGLRLDSRDGWQTGGDSGPAITPGQPGLSLLIKAVSYTDRDLKMPPKRKLSDGEIATLTEWIAQGAPDPRSATTASAHRKIHAPTVEEGRGFWSFQPLKNPAAPVVNDASWPRGDIDRHVLANLEKAGLKPAADADRSVLARRLAFDLTGLPPEEDAVTTDFTAYIDRLLASPQFAERWAQHWLDIVRFAESSGGGRTLPFKDAWRYRDYVIESIEKDVPLDRFLVEQIAGDLLPYSDAATRRRQLTATGFLALGPTNYEEQDKNMLRMDIVDEQLDTIGKSFLGMTIGCARCHDHKFDPIPTSDYYALAGIFRSTKVIRDPKENVAHWIDTPLPLDGDEEAAMQRHEAELRQLEADLEIARKELKARAPKREPKDGKVRPIAVDDLPGIVVDDVDAKKVGDWKLSTRYPTYVGDGYLHDDNEGKGTKTLTFAPKIPRAGRYEVRFSYTSIASRADNVPVTVLHADGEESLTVDESVPPTIDGRFISLGQYRFEANGEGYVLVSNTGTSGHVTADAVVFIPVGELKRLDPDFDSTGKEPALVAAENRVKEIENRLKQMKKNGPVRPEVMSVTDHDETGDCPVHIRGSIRNLGDVVPRGFLRVAMSGNQPAIPEGQSGRVQFARWLTSPRNPLTARVLANRVWLWLFGEGLVRTPDNFGSTGEAPTHPELVDHLAAKLIQEDWSLKGLVRYIVQSRTYQMSSAVTAESKDALSIDPDNRLLWRQNRKRSDANALRDAILTAAGTLDQRHLGPTIGNGDAVDPNDMGAQDLEYGYQFVDTRRSVYTPAFRNRRLELFDAFDFGDINQPLGRRNTSTVAPQALYLMNHEFVIQQARRAASRLLADSSLQNDRARTQAAFRRTLGREPSAREERLAVDFTTVSASEPDAEARRQESWALLFQSLFASADFRYID